MISPIKKRRMREIVTFFFLSFRKKSDSEGSFCDSVEYICFLNEKCFSFLVQFPVNPPEKKTTSGLVDVVTASVD